MTPIFLSAQCFLSIHAAVQNAFYVRRHLPARAVLQIFRAETFAAWRQNCLAALSVAQHIAADRDT